MKALYCLGYLGLVPTLTPRVKEYSQLGHFQSMFVSSIIASSFAISLSHPFDTMKTNLQGDLGKNY